ncbi:MAG: hypothetical protein ACAI38_13245 [Myxococcota bacterium]|nr:hypothetical protein [Myxococcota bacterium]
MKLRVLGAAAVLAVLAYPLPSYASFHFTLINEVFAGSQYDGDVQYIEIKAYSGSQNLFNGQSLTISDRNNVTTTLTFNRNLPGSASQMTVLIATQAAAARLNVTPDFIMQPVIDREGGKICFVGVDCFAWGTFNGTTGTGANDFGTKYEATNGLPLDQAVVRDDGGDVLQASDDTNDSAADFDAGTPTPRNNAGVTGDYLPDCGNGAEDSGEECDDANTSQTDACSVRCEDAECGDGIAQTGGVEECDDGNGVNTDACRNDCQLPACGDGVVSTGEQCEPPSTATCTDTCLVINVGCGDGLPDAGEECDDGNTASNDGCRGNCTNEVCGDGIVDFDEDCDDGNTANGDSCRGDCQVPGCGDSVVDAGETCDDGNTTVGDGCDATCIIEEDDHDHEEPGDEDPVAEDDGCASTKPNLAWLAMFLAIIGGRLIRRR